MNLQSSAHGAKEIRFNKDIELRQNDLGQSIAAGYAVVYNSLSEDLGGFRERIQPGALTAALANSDVRCLRDHNPSLVLGRNTAGTLRLQDTPQGLYFECNLPPTTTGNDTRVSLERGDLTGCSFAFYVAKDEYVKEASGTVRVITEISQLDDVSIVTYPAYPATSVDLRSFDEYKAKETLAKLEQLKRKLKLYELSAGA